MTKRFILSVSLDGSIGIFLLMKHLTPMSPDKIPLHRALPLHCRPHEDKKNWVWGSLLLKRGNVSAHLRGMRPARTSGKDTLHSQRESPTIILIIKILTSYLLTIFSHFAYIRIQIQYVSITNIHKYSATYSIRNILLYWTRLGRNHYGTNKFFWSIVNLEVTVFILFYLFS